MQKERIVWAIFGLILSAVFYVSVWKHIPDPTVLLQQQSNISLPLQLQATATVIAKQPSAWDIVHNAYNATFRHLAESCQYKNETFRNCLGKLERKGFTANHWPWWFQSLLRDATKGGIHAPWHDLQVVNPPMKLCVIEKIGTKQWRRLQCLLNAGFSPLVPHTCHPHKYNLTPPPEDAPRVVFTRDPLERFLSAFIDKCLYNDRRIHEKHCEPVQIYTPGQEIESDRKKSLVDMFLSSEQRFFDAYVDTFPLKWNIHFFPASLYCDGLYRHLSAYDFVGHMGPNFYNDLSSMVEIIGAKTNNKTALEQAVEQVFQVTQNIQKENVGIETSAATRVEHYYTPRTVRKVLEYTAIDYVMLNLSIPEWAEKMLQEDEKP